MSLKSTTFAGSTRTIHLINFCNIQLVPIPDLQESDRCQLKINKMITIAVSYIFLPGAPIESSNVVHTEHTYNVRVMLSFVSQ